MIENRVIHSRHPTPAERRPLLTQPWHTRESGRLRLGLVHPESYTIYRTGIIAAMASSAQPARRRSPPIGVIAPIHRHPPSVNA